MGIIHGVITKTITILFDALHLSQHFFSHVPRFSLVEPVLKAMLKNTTLQSGQDSNLQPCQVVV